MPASEQIDRLLDRRNQVQEALARRRTARAVAEREEQEAAAELHKIESEVLRALEARAKELRNGR